MPLLRSLLLLALLGLASPVAAQETPEAPAPAGTTLTLDQQNQVALKLTTQFMSPYCPGASLRDCGSGQAEVLRQRIRGWVAEGRSESWIEDQLVSEFGEMILGAPRFQGWGTIAYIAPVLALLLGLGAILAFLQRQRGAASQKPVDQVDTPQDFTLSRETEAAVDRELELRSR